MGSSRTPKPSSFASFSVSLPMRRTTSPTWISSTNFSPPPTKSLFTDIVTTTTTLPPTKGPTKDFSDTYIKNNGNANPRPPDGLLVKHREERDKKKKEKKKKKIIALSFSKKKKIASRFVFKIIFFLSRFLWKKMFIYYDIYIDLTFPYHHSKLLSSLKKNLCHC